MAQAGPSRPSPTEKVIIECISITENRMRERVNKVIEHVNKLREDVEHSAEHEMLNDLRMGKIEQMEKKLKKRFNDHCRRIEHTKEEVEQRFDDRCQKIEETQEEVEQRFDDRCQKTEKTQEEMEKRFDNRCQKIEEAQEEVEQRFDDRCQKMEETQRKIVEALKELSGGSSKQGSFASALSNALKQVFANPLHYAEKVPTVPTQTQAQMANFFSGPIRLVSSDQIPLLAKLQNLYTVLKVHWKASRYLDSTMTAAYPWLCFAMASCYYLAVSSWFLDYAHYVYKWYTMGSKYNIAKSEQILGVIFYCLQIAVPYTVGLGKRFSILFVILLWFVVDAKF